ncbi:MAG: DUF3850 domain-containing protein [Desulfosporosinus sp.]|nr:DUF3850 domain-containing protein [Desulfosporosinus sp.]
MNHNLKTWPEQFKAVKSGLKTFEERIDDRGYEVGDTLTLQEFDPLAQEYTGDVLVKSVPYILREPYAREGHVIMSIKDPVENNDPHKITASDMFVAMAQVKATCVACGSCFTEDPNYDCPALRSRDTRKIAVAGMGMSGAAEQLRKTANMIIQAKQVNVVQMAEDLAQEIDKATAKLLVDNTAAVLGGDKELLALWEQGEQARKKAEAEERHKRETGRGGKYPPGTRPHDVRGWKPK